MTLEKFRQQVGPFALIQQPAAEEAQRLGLSFAAQRTLTSAEENISMGALGLLFQFERLQVSTLPPLSADTELSVGRAADCDLLVDHASVSKHHAQLRWKDA